MEPAFDAPVIIVGGGPVGYALALGLAHHGVRSILLDKKAEPAQQSRALGVWGRTIEILRDWGAGEALLAAGSYYTAATIHDAKTGRPLVSIDFTSISDVFENPGALVIPQYETERIVRERALATGMCDARAGWEVTGVDQDRNGVAIRAVAGGQERTLRAQFAAGCDGAHSFIRQALGMTLDGATYDVRAVLSDEHVEGDDPSGPFLRVAVDRPGLLMGVRYAPNTWRVIASVPRDVTDEQALDERAHAQRVASVFERPVESQTLWKSLYALHRRRAKSFVSGRIALAGDAAHLVSPAGGEGMNAGIADTANLAWKLAYAVEGRGDAAMLLRSYDEERQQIITEIVEAASDRLTKFTMQTRALIKKLGAGVMARALRERGMQRKACRAIGMLSGRYTKSPIVDSRHPLAGRRIDDLVLPNGSRINRVRAGKAVLVAVGKADLGGLAAIPIPVPPKRWVVKPPVVLVVRPDGIVAAVVEKPNRARVEAAWKTAFAGDALS